MTNATLTASQWNASVRDNLLETAVAKAAAAGQIFAATGANALAARTPTGASVPDQQTTSSNTYADLATAGPAVTVTTGPAALVCLAAMGNDASAPGQWAYMGYGITGATTLAASDDRSISFQYWSGHGAAMLQTGLTPGSNVFTSKYRTSGGSTGTWQYRRLAVIPF